MEYRPAAFCPVMYLIIYPLKSGYVNSLGTLFTVYDIKRNGSAFFQGIDVKGMLRAGYQFIKTGGAEAQGASTISCLKSMYSVMSASARRILDWIRKR